MIYKKTFTLTILFSILAISSSMAFATQTLPGDADRTVSKQVDPKPETLGEALAKTKETASASDLEVKKTMAAYRDQMPKAPGKKLSTKSKILIGVGIAAAAIGVAVIVWAAKER